jgi:alanine dehydrogenase
MDIAIPKEVKSREHRVALAPSGVKALVQKGHRVYVEAGAGGAAGHPDADYESAGARLVWSRGEAFGRGQLVAAVFAPDASEAALLQPGQVVMAFWALPLVRPDELRAFLDRRITAIGLEAIEDETGRAPVLTSMSEIAGALAITVGAGLLLNDLGGKGVVMGGAPGVPPANVLILGAGVLGKAAARVATGMGAQVTLLDVSVDRLREALLGLRGPVATCLSTRPNLEKALGYADLVLGAVAVHAERAPVLVPRELVRLMKPRSVILDLSIDMGGCFETSRPTSFPNPTYEAEGVLHFCVPNLPSTAARSATLALTNAVLPFMLHVADAGLEAALLERPDLRRGVYLKDGAVERESLRRTLGGGH